MSVTVRGSTIQQQPTKRRYQDGQGWVTVRRWLGTRAAVEEYARTSALVLSADSYDINDGGAKSELVAQYVQTDTPGGAGANIVWELYSERLYKDIRTMTSLDTEAQSQLEAVDLAIREGRSAQYIVDMSPSVAMQKYIALRLRGVEQYMAWSYRVRKTTNVGTRSTLRASFTGVGTVRATSPVAGVTVSPNSRAARPLFDVPTGEWYKCPPQVTTLGRNRFRIIQEWLWAEKWSATLYSGGTGTP